MSIDLNREKEPKSRSSDPPPERRTKMGPLLRLDSTGESTPSYHHVTHADKFQGQREDKRNISNCIEKLICHLQRANSSADNLTAGNRIQRSWFKKPFGSDSCEMKRPATEAPYPGSSPDVDRTPPVKTNDRFDCLKTPPCSKGFSRKLMGAFQCDLSKQLKNSHNMNSACHWRNNRWSSPRETYSCPSRQKTPSSVTHEHAEVIDPKLKPYNARLLQKSKRTRDESAKNCCEEKLLTCTENYESACVKDEQNIRANPKQLPIPQVCMSENTLQHTATVIEDRHAQCPTTAPCVPQTPDVDSSKKECDKTDWFDYKSEISGVASASESVLTGSGNVTTKTMPSECLTSNTEVSDSQSVPVAPISTVGCESAGSDMATSPPLHSWFSMEEHSEKSENLKGKCSETQKENFPTTNSEKQKCENNENKKKDAFVHSINVKVRHMDGHPERNSQKTENSTEHKDLSFQLYMRNCSNKKRRPSARKRMRQKAKQEENTDKKEDKSSSGQSCQPFSFLVGSTSNSFVVSFNDDEDFSDWSDSDDNDTDTDSPQTSLDDACLEMFSNPLNFHVFCSFPSTSTTNCALDAINLAWKIDISVDKPTPKKNRSVNSVSFAVDDLITVHPMIAWGYAYQAARKGPWEEYARDRGRFLLRITDTEKLLKPVLHEKHRRVVYKDRFAGND